jgi:hypothetical protein
MVEDPQKESVPDGGQGTKPLGAGHPAGDNKALGELRGLMGLGQTLSKQTSHIGRARNEAITTIKNGLVFTELDTLMTVARLARTTHDQAHGNTRQTQQGGWAPMNQRAQLDKNSTHLVAERTVELSINSPRIWPRLVDTDGIRWAFWEELWKTQDDHNWQPYWLLPDRDRQNGGRRLAFYATY